MKRMNITLSDELVEFLEKKPNKSRYIAEALTEKVNREKKEQTRRILIEGYKNERKEGCIVNEEWESSTMDKWE